jgi:predicted nucleic acid-binding protein
MAAKRIVLDTNIWLDWLVFNDLSVLHLKKVTSEGEARIFIDAACESELERVLAYDLELARRTKPFRILAPRKFPA